MQQYEEAFRDNAIDAAVLPELTADDLKDLGVNLMFCDLVGSTALSSHLDPEDYREVIAA